MHSKNKENWNTILKYTNEEEILEAYFRAEDFMGTLNLLGAKLLKKYKCRASTDITGFGVLGHSKFLVEC